MSVVEWALLQAVNCAAVTVWPVFDREGYPTGRQPAGYVKPICKGCPAAVALMPGRRLGLHDGCGKSFQFVDGQRLNHSGTSISLEARCGAPASCAPSVQLCRTVSKFLPRYGPCGQPSRRPCPHSCAMASKRRCTTPPSSAGRSTRYNRSAPLPLSARIGAGHPSEDSQAASVGPRPPPRNAHRRWPICRFAGSGRSRGGTIAAG